ncbi:MAG TPA: sugar transferase [Nitrospirota bacterium]|nr:sugar transferase [Nitrospirota bacterium]
MNKLELFDHNAVPRHSQVLYTDEFGCYGEDYFHELLAFERKRSERSGRAFLLMKLDFTGIRDDESRIEVVTRAVQSLSTITRETDIKGWSCYPIVLGVLFTEMNSAKTEALQKKIFQGLQAALTKEQLEVLLLSFHWFPDEGTTDDPRGQMRFTFYPDIPEKERHRTTSLKVKRIIDVIGSIAGILIFSPFLILVPIGIKLTSRGPVFFRQERVGQYGKKFMFLKFRSMYANNDPDVHKKYVQNLINGKVSGDVGSSATSQKVYKITKDERVTAFGHFLRITSLDEVPQFINVFRGEMSLVGPRPPIPYELEKYKIWHRRRILEIKPGITGLWQIRGRSSITFDEMVRLDLQYARTWDLWMDVKILLKTPWIVLIAKGAY